MVKKKKKKIHLHCGRPGFDPWVGNIPWRRKWLLTPVLSGEFYRQRYLAGCSPWGHRAGHDWATFTLYISSIFQFCLQFIWLLGLLFMKSLKHGSWSFSHYFGNVTFSNSITLLKEMTHIGLHSTLLNYEWFLRLHTSSFSYYLWRESPVTE